ncbi:MAG: hypothetical protein AUH42_02840 [Gemmatimonadetes bacterium 13_1_40CM_70_11]|nr:MAG: hypothetical protein AUH42_02840 [Gemmatimonadetes bacterium 13_1_40CM_70_11]
MFRMILYTQWKWSRLLVVAGTLAAFAIPVLSVRSAGEYNLQHWEAVALLNSIESWGVLYPILAGALAVLMAMTAWAPDHRGRHVYALSLPVPRFGGLVGTATSMIPPGLHAYPHVLALRFALAALVAYGVFFAISAGTTRIAGYILAVIATIVIAQMFLSATHIGGDFIGALFDRLLTWPGPLEIFTGRWMLIDV